MPPKSRSTANEILSPSILPALMGTSPPSGPVVEPASIPPSALNVNATGTGPIGVSIIPVHLPSTVAAKTDVETRRTPRTPSNNARVLIRDSFLWLQRERSRADGPRRTTVVAGNAQDSGQHPKRCD